MTKIKFLKVLLIVLSFSSTSLLSSPNIFCSKFINDNNQTFNAQKHDITCHKKSDSENKSKVCFRCNCNVGNFFLNELINISTHDFPIEYEILDFSLNYFSTIKNIKPPPKIFS